MQIAGRPATNWARDRCSGSGVASDRSSRSCRPKTSIGDTRRRRNWSWRRSSQPITAATSVSDCSRDPLGRTRRGDAGLLQRRDRSLDAVEVAALPRTIKPNSGTSSQPVLPGDSPTAGGQVARSRHGSASGRRESTAPTG